MNISRQTVEALKSNGHYFAAGALAASLGMDRDSYGCHYGMRSDLAKAKLDYVNGWKACEGI